MRILTLLLLLALPATASGQTVEFVEEFPLNYDAIGLQPDGSIFLRLGNPPPQRWFLWRDGIEYDVGLPPGFSVGAGVPKIRLNSTGTGYVLWDGRMLNELGEQVFGVVWEVDLQGQFVSTLVDEPDHISDFDHGSGVYATLNNGVYTLFGIPPPPEPYPDSIVGAVRVGSEGVVAARTSAFGFLDEQHHTYIWRFASPGWSIDQPPVPLGERFVPVFFDSLDYRIYATSFPVPCQFGRLVLEDSTGDSECTFSSVIVTKSGTIVENVDTTGDWSVDDVRIRSFGDPEGVLLGLNDNRGTGGYLEDRQWLIKTPPAVLYHVIFPTEFIRGDANQDGVVTKTDGMLIKRQVQGKDPIFCADASDADDDGDIDFADAIFVIQQGHSGVPIIPPPFPSCGPDPTDDLLDCVSHGACP